MSEIADFLTAQYDRIEKRERGKFAIPYRPNLHCPACGRPVDGTTHSSGEDHVCFEPCGHTMPNVEYVERYGKSDADPFVLADIASKRRILELHGDQHECTDTRSSEYPYVGCETARLLAAPFSGEPGYKQEWAV